MWNLDELGNQKSLICWKVTWRQKWEKVTRRENALTDVIHIKCIRTGYELSLLLSTYQIIIFFYLYSHFIEVFQKKMLICEQLLQFYDMHYFIYITDGAAAALTQGLQGFSYTQCYKQLCFPVFRKFNSMTNVFNLLNFCTLPLLERSWSGQLNYHRGSASLCLSD